MTPQLDISLVSSSKGSLNIEHIDDSYLFMYPCPSEYECTFYQTVLPKGQYILEVWGAQRGNRFEEGGRGGYSRGVLHLNEDIKVFIALGGQPEYFSDSTKRVIRGGFNGGGAAVKPSNCNGGGGGTDIRLINSTLYHRVLVAGGGGGGPGLANRAAGAGGGIEGQINEQGPSTSGGKQDSGGTGGYNSQGSFGIGGDHGAESGGGGGGWYGGCSSDNYAANRAGSGGSGYVFNSTSYKPDGFMLSSTFHLTEGDTIQGTLNFPCPSGEIYRGNIGHGSARITILFGDFDHKVSVHSRLANNLLSSLLSFIMLSSYS